MIFKQKIKLDTLDQFWAFADTMLLKGAKNFMHPFHNAVLATESGGQPHVRTVILRNYQVDRQQLVCHSDVRAPKIEQIRKNPHVTWLFYDAKSRLQLRIAATADVHTDDAVADKWWESIRITNKINYCTTRPPGAGSGSPLRQDFRNG